MKKKTRFCSSWPNKTLKMSGRLWNIGILLTDRTIMPYWNLILPLSSLFYRMWRHFSLDDLDTQKVPGVAECSPPPLKLTGKQCWRWDRFVEFGIKLLVLIRIFIVEFCYNLATILCYLLIKNVWWHLNRWRHKWYNEHEHFSGHIMATWASKSFKYVRASKCART